MKCRACSGSLKDRPDLGVSISECRSCGGIQGRTYLGDSYALVKPRFATAPELRAAEAAGSIRYFDLDCVGSKGLERRHGWFDTVTRAIVQVG